MIINQLYKNNKKNSMIFRIKFKIIDKIKNL